MNLPVVFVWGGVVIRKTMKKNFVNDWGSMLNKQGIIYARPRHGAQQPPALLAQLSRRAAVRKHPLLFSWTTKTGMESGMIERLRRWCMNSSMRSKHRPLLEESWLSLAYKSHTMWKHREVEKSERSNRVKNREASFIILERIVKSGWPRGLSPYDNLLISHSWKRRNKHWKQMELSPQKNCSSIHPCGELSLMELSDRQKERQKKCSAENNSVNPAGSKAKQ